MGQACSAASNKLSAAAEKRNGEDAAGSTVITINVRLIGFDHHHDEETVVRVEPRFSMRLQLADRLHLWDRRVRRVIFGGLDIEDTVEDTFELHGIEDGACVSLCVSTWEEIASDGSAPQLEHLALVELNTLSRGHSWERPWQKERVPRVGGVTLDEQGCVSEIDLHYNNLHGSLTEALAVLPQLQVLYLVQNRLQGGLPDSLSRLSHLTDLILSHNELEGSLPASYATLPSLTHLNLSHNKLHGLIPEEWNTGFHALKQLDLSFNALTGHPVAFAGAAQLEHLALHNNAFFVQQVSAV